MQKFTPDMFGLTGHGMRLRTIRGYDFGEVSSAMQKAIRRGKLHTPVTGPWSCGPVGFGHYVWKRLLTVSAEDCWGIITKEVKALHESYAMINANLSGRRARGRIFISKAVILLCASKKSRDADHLQNLVYDEMRGIDPDTLADELRSAPEYVAVPDYAFDCHTRRGKAMGKTKADFFKAEQAALVPLEQGLFDHLVDA
jgi:replication-associated recombination protein RarA